MQHTQQEEVKKVITISLDEVTKQFTVPDTITDLELDIWFSVVKEKWKKQRKEEKALKEFVEITKDTEDTELIAKKTEKRLDEAVEDFPNHPDKELFIWVAIAMLL